jgi:hypothetical protein
VWLNRRQRARGGVGKANQRLAICGHKQAKATTGLGAATKPGRMRVAAVTSGPKGPNIDNVQVAEDPHSRRLVHNAILDLRPPSLGYLGSSSNQGSTPSTAQHLHLGVSSDVVGYIQGRHCDAMGRYHALCKAVTKPPARKLAHGLACTGPSVGCLASELH